MPTKKTGGIDRLRLSRPACRSARARHHDGPHCKYIKHGPTGRVKRTGRAKRIMKPADGCGRPLRYLRQAVAIPANLSFPRRPSVSASSSSSSCSVQGHGARCQGSRAARARRARPAGRRPAHFRAAPATMPSPKATRSCGPVRIQTQAPRAPHLTRPPEPAT
jgi:hypothetical protein